MPRGVILVDYTDQGRRAIKDSPNRAEASKAEAAKLGVSRFLRKPFDLADVTRITQECCRNNQEAG